MKLNIFLVCFSVLFASGCVSSGSARLSEREVMVQSSADPVCGAHGALIAAQKQAAIETIKAGYDKYIVLGAFQAVSARAILGPQWMEIVHTGVFNCM